MRRAIHLALMVAALALWLPSSADAASVRLVRHDGGPNGRCVDPCLVVTGTEAADALLIVPRPQCCGVVVAGQTPRAGEGCQDAVGPEGERSVVCALADGQRLSRVEAQLGGGDDRLLVHPALETTGRVYPWTGGILPSMLDGGEGADAIEARDEIRGGGGNDVLRLNVASRWSFIDGGSGDDQLRAGKGSVTLDGGTGADVLGGGAGNDALISAGDQGGRDRVLCGGGRDLVQQDLRDTVDCSKRSRINALAKVRHRWFVLGRHTYPTLLRIRPLPELRVVDGSLFVGCDGKPCRSARFRPNSASVFDDTRVRLVRGGVRAAARRGRAVLPGARVGFRMVFHLNGAILIEKRLEFIARFHKLPRVRKRCTITRGDEGDRRVPVPCF